MKGYHPWGRSTREPTGLSFVALLIQAHWRVRARCATTKADPLWFYPERSSGQRVDHGLILNELRAKACCVRCPVRTECLEAGLYEEHGIWGGMLPFERRRLHHDADCELRRDRLHHGKRGCRPDDEQVVDGLTLMRAQAEQRGLIGRPEQEVA